LILFRAIQRLGVNKSNSMNIFKAWVKRQKVNFPDIFHKAKGSIVYSKSGVEYIDFLAGAGALNYGHNNDYIKQKVMSYFWYRTWSGHT